MGNEEIGPWMFEKCYETHSNQEAVASKDPLGLNLQKDIGLVSPT